MTTFQIIWEFPQLFAVALVEPTTLGQVDKTVRYARILHDFPDGMTRLLSLIVEPGPRPFFLDRDACAVTAFYPPEVGGEGCWWQISCTVPSHFPSVRSAVRDHSMYWGYKLEPFKDEVGGKTFTHVTLISQTEVFGWLPQFLVNLMVVKALPDYVTRVGNYLEDLLDRQAPAKALAESYGVVL